jgi:hypothetical protein
MDELSILRKRLIKIGIEPIFMGNFPWIYLYSINGNVIKPEDYDANHGYTIAWYPSQYGDSTTLNNTKKTFKVIRKYI